MISLTPAGAALLACLWYTGTSLEGMRVQREGRSPQLDMVHLTGHEPAAVWRTRLASSAEKIKGSADPLVHSDHAAILVRLGRLDEAIALLEDLEKRSPGNYYVAANLGTALELKGDLEGALQWIQEGIRRNPEAHNGTEWLHVKILEARIALAKDPTWLETHSVLGIDFGSEPKPAMPPGFLVRGSAGFSEGERARAALELQLHERLSLVKPPDPIVGDLLFDLSNVWALSASVEHARLALDLAEQYGVPRPLLARERSKAYAGTVSAGLVRTTVKYALIALGAIAACTAVIWLIRRLAGRG